MKKNTAYTLGSLVILLICAFCFVILPAFTGAGNKQQEIPSFGKYNGKEIKNTQDSVFANFVSQYGSLYQMYGQQLDSSTYFYIYNNAFNATVMDYAYTEAVEKSGYEVPQTAINRQMLPYFYDENGNYSSKLYRQTSDSTKEELAKSAKKTLISERFYDDNFGSTSEYIGSNNLYGLKTANSELDFLVSYNSEKRGFNMATFDMSNFPDSEKVKYGKANAAKFNKVDMSIITVEDKATADKVANRISAGEITFEDAVSEYSTKNYSNTEGKLNNSYQYQIENMLANPSDIAAIVALSKDSVSEAIETKNGYSLFKNDGSLTTPDFTDDAVIGIVGAYVRAYETSVIEDYFIAKAKDFTKEAMNSDFIETCDKYDDIEYVDITPFALNYGNVDIANTLNTQCTGLAGAETNENFYRTAFSLKMNEYSDPIVLNNNYVAVLQYSTEATNSEFDSVINADQLNGYDEDSAQQVTLSSDKLENHFLDVYIENYMMR